MVKLLSNILAHALANYLVKLCHHQEFDCLWTAMTDPIRLTQAAADLALSCAAPSTVSTLMPAAPSSAASIPAPNAASTQLPAAWRPYSALPATASTFASVTVSTGRSPRPIASAQASSGRSRGLGSGGSVGARGTVAVVMSALQGGTRSGGSHVHAVTDAWKLDLLSVLVCDCYFTAQQVGGAGDSDGGAMGVRMVYGGGGESEVAVEVLG